MIARQHIYLAAGGEPVFSRLQRNESGNYQFVDVNDSKVVLPAVETTDIQALLEAGIDPKRVDTKIIPSSSVVTDLAAEVETETKVDEKGE